MKASKLSEAQKAFILKQASDGMPVRTYPQGGVHPGDLLQLEEALQGMQPRRCARNQLLETTPS